VQKATLTCCGMGAVYVLVGAGQRAQDERVKGALEVLLQQIDCSLYRCDYRRVSELKCLLCG